MLTLQRQLVDVCSECTAVQQIVARHFPKSRIVAVDRTYTPLKSSTNKPYKRFAVHWLLFQPIKVHHTPSHHVTAHWAVTMAFVLLISSSLFSARSVGQATL
jgi:hypothetical protein